MDAVRALAEEIGPRLPCSKEEERAAHWCAARLTDFGLDVEVERFASRPLYQPWYAGYFLLSCAGALALVPLPLTGFVCGIVALVLYGRDVDGRPLLRPRSGSSHNVVARAPGAPRLVVVAHLDSAVSSLPFRPRLVGALRATVVGLHAALFLVPLLAAAAWIAEVEGRLPGALWLPAGALALYLAYAAAVQFHAARRREAVPGANDNASGVDVLLRLAASRPEATWFVVTGSEESGMLGIQAFLEAHGDDVREAAFLNLDSVGAGRVGAAWEEGILRAHAADRDLVAAAEAAGIETFSYRLMPTDATALLGRGRKALSLIARDERGLIPNWHLPSDVASHLDPGTLDRAEAAARALIARVLAPPVRP